MPIVNIVSERDSDGKLALRSLSVAQQNDARHQATGRTMLTPTQVVTIPLEYRFPESMKEVFIRKVGEDVILSPRPTDWSGFLASGVHASDDFMTRVEDLPVQERDFA